MHLAEENYYKNLASSLDTNPNSGKKWWKTVKVFMNKHNGSSYPPMLIDNQIISDNTAKAEAFNNFFLSHMNLDGLSAEPDTNGNPIGSHIDNICVTESEVLDLLNNIDTSKATGPDGVTPRLLKEAAPVIYKPLTKLFQLSLNQSKFPTAWKDANVIPLHKKLEKNIISHYHPISLLSCVSKIFERVVFKYVFNYFRDNFLITVYQSGFIPGDSTVNQLVHLYHTFCEALNNQKDIRVVFCDISKAFDRVWHKGLIEKLKRSGIRGSLLTWFIDYLSDRRQRVVIEGKESNWGQIGAGVPQGSVLGPLLFLIYINDIVNIVDSPIRLFADDTSLFVIVDNPATAANSLNSDLSNISMWPDKWKIDFNPNKTKSLLITRKRNPPENSPLYLNNFEISDVKSHKQDRPYNYQ